MNELIVYGGRPVRGFNVGLGDGSVGDLLAYRRMWDPFIAAHVALWRKVNALLEAIPAAQGCPPGITKDPDSFNKLDATTQRYCWDLILSRIVISQTDPAGIPHMWNAWAGRSDADILQGAGAMLKWLQQTVTTVGGPYKSDLLDIAGRWNIPIDLPPVPKFKLQQEIIARIEGAWISLKGILQIVGYGAGQVLEMAGSVTEALAKGLKEVAEALPKVIGSPWTWVGLTAVIAAVGAGLVIYYVPRRSTA